LTILRASEEDLMTGSSDTYLSAPLLAVHSPPSSFVTSSIILALMSSRQVGVSLSMCHQLLFTVEYWIHFIRQSVRLREIGLPIGTSSKVSASVKEGCPLNRGYDNSILLKKTNGTWDMCPLKRGVRLREVSAYRGSTRSETWGGVGGDGGVITPPPQSTNHMDWQGESSGLAGQSKS
jgi:hypothetical protein